MARGILMGFTGTQLLVLGGLAAAALIVLSPGSADEPEEARSTSTCSWKDPGALVEQLSTDTQTCIESLLNQTQDQEGEFHTVALAYDGSTWDQSTEPFWNPGASQYSYESLGATDLAGTLRVLNEKKEVYTASFNYGDPASFLEIDFIDLPGRDYVEVTDAGGSTYVFEVA